MERFYLPVHFLEGQEATIEGTEFHHMVHAVRIGSGQEIELVNGKGQLATGSVERLEKKKATIRLHNVVSEQAPAREIILAQAIPRINRLDFIVEKGTELGMTQLWLFPGERSERKLLTTTQLERCEAISIAAMKQCGRLYLPKIMLKQSLSHWTASDVSVGDGFFGDLAVDAPTFAQEKTSGNNILFYVGPESGFSATEEKILQEKLKAKGVKLHSNILRTDTAALAALCLMTCD